MLASFFDARRSKRLASLSIMSVVFSSSFTTLPGVALAASTDICTPQDIAQVAYWKLDEAAASDPVTDTGAGAHTGTALGAGGGNNLPQPVTGAPALPFLNAFGKNFDGMDDGIDLGSNVGNFGYGDSFTISAWINPALDSANRVIYGNAWQNAGYELRVTSTNTLRFILIHNGSNYNGMDTNVLSAGWHHVVGTWDGANLKVYVDGTEDSATPITGGTVTTISTSAHTFIGQTPEAGFEQYFKGDIDDVRVFNDDLSAGQVARLAAGRCGADKLTSTNTLSSDWNPSVIGDLVNLTATLTGYAPTGSVEFFDGATSLGTVSVSNSKAIFSTDTLAVGSHSITATYSGDDDNTGSTASLIVQVVDPSPTCTLNLSVPNPSIVGELVTFSALVCGFEPTGTVEFFDGATSLGTSSLSTVDPSLSLAIFNISTLTVGSHNITATYSGDTNNLTSSDSALVQIVDQAPSTTVNLSAPNPSTVGQNVDFVATVTGYAPTGSVEFFDGATSLGTVSVSTLTSTTSEAVFSTSALTVGSHSITATYSGDANNITSSDSALVQVVDQSPTTTVNLSATNPSIIGQNVDFTATVTGFNPGGSVEFFDGAVSLGTVSVSVVNATTSEAVYSTSSLAVGSHTITATYSGDTNNVTSSDSALVQVVNQSPTTTVDLSVPNPSIVGQNVDFTATVTGFNPGGSVEFFDGAVSLGTVSVSVVNATTSEAVFSTSALTVGSHNITATYSGDTNNITSSDSALVQVVDQSPTSTVNLSVPNPSIVGQNVDFTATVTGFNPGGSVEFFDGAVSLGTVSVSVVNATTSEAVYSTSSLAVGSHNITATYSGDTNNVTSSDSALVQVVDQSPTTTVNLSAPNPSIVGSNVAFTATITGFNPGGSVEFFDGAVSLGTVSLSVLNATTSEAVFNTSSLAVGSHNITATYSGDVNNITSSDTTVVQVVDQSPTTTVSLSAPNPSIVGNNVDFTATVTGFNPGGSVEFFDGAVSMGSVSVSVLNATTSEAVFSTSALTVGSHSITATYSGDVNNLTSSDSSLVQVVDQSPTTTVLISFESPVFVGDAVNFFVQVTGFLPSGDITITSNGEVIGIGTLDPSGFVEIAVVTNTVGTFTVQAHYAGDVNNLPSESEESLLAIIGGSSGRFQSLVRYLTGNMATGFGSMNTPTGAFGGPGPGNGTGELTDEQVQTLCAVRDQILALNATAVLDYMTDVYAHIFDVSDNAILAVIRDGEGCGVEAAAVEQEEEQSTAEGAVAKVDRHAPVALPVDEKGIPVSSNEVWNACIRNYQLFNGNDTRPLSCRKYHKGHTWEHPDLGLTFTWTDRLVQQIRMRKNFVTVVVPTPGYVVNRSMETDTVQMPFTVSVRTGNAQ